MKTISKTTLVAFTLAIASFASQAQAHHVLRLLPRSGVPYTVPHVEPGYAKPALVQKARQGTPVQVKPASKLQIIR